MATSIYCATKLSAHDNVQCNDYFSGGATELIVFNEGATTTDYTDETTIAADLASGEAILATDVYLDLPAGSVKEVQNPVTGDPIKQGVNRTLNILDWNVTEQNNNIFYSDLNRFTAKAVLIYETLNDGVGRASLIANTNSGIKFNVDRIIPLADAEVQSLAGVATWSAFDNPTIQDVPTGIFGQ